MLGTSMPPWPSFDAEEAAAVQRVLLSNRVNYWTGQEGRAFEREFADWVGAGYAIALANGTNALELALQALGLGAGDEVVTTPRTFVATASAIASVGARPVFADVDADSQNITADTIEPVLNQRTKALLVVHLAGQPCDMDPIMALADKHNLVVIEDCAQAHGARYRGRSVGSIGHVGAWSFCQDKIMSTGGEGGMVTTSDEELWRKMWALKDHGKSYAAVFEREHAPGFRWLHEDFGSNYRMTEMQAAIGRIQLERMVDWNRQRNAHALQIRETARALPTLRVPRDVCSLGCPSRGCPGCVHAQYKCYLFVDPDKLGAGWNRDRLMAEINAAGIPCYSGSCPELYREQAFVKRGWSPERELPIARRLGETSLMFLVHPTLLDTDIERTCAVLRRVASRASA